MEFDPFALEFSERNTYNQRLTEQDVKNIVALLEHKYSIKDIMTLAKISLKCLQNIKDGKHRHNKIPVIVDRGDVKYFGKKPLLQRSWHTLKWDEEDHKRFGYNLLRLYLNRVELYETIWPPHIYPPQFWPRALSASSPSVKHKYHQTRRTYSVEKLLATYIDEGYVKADIDVLKEGMKEFSKLWLDNSLENL